MVLPKPGSGVEDPFRQQMDWLTYRSGQERLLPARSAGRLRQWTGSGSGSGSGTETCMLSEIAYSSSGERTRLWRPRRAK
jgi:hypothetical protein